MNEEGFKQWRRMPETQEFFRYLWHCRLMAMEEWADRQHLNEQDVQASMHANAMALGGVKVLTSMLDVNFGDIEHFYKQTGGMGEFQYQARRKDVDQEGVRVDAAGPA